MDEDSQETRQSQAFLPELDNEEEIVRPPKTDAEHEIERAKAKYRHETDGTLWNGSGDSPKLVSKAHIKVTGTLMSPDGTGWATKVEFNDEMGQRRTINIPNATLLDPRETLRLLADAGFVKQWCRAPVAKYLAEVSSTRFIYQVSRAGWTKDGEVYVCQSFQMGAREDNCHEYEYTGIDTRACISGTIGEWQKHVGELCCGNPVLVFALCAALSGPALRFFPSHTSTMFHLSLTLLHFLLSPSHADEGWSGPVGALVSCCFSPICVAGTSESPASYASPVLHTGFCLHGFMSVACTGMPVAEG
jgi:hypothetical protein